MKDEGNGSLVRYEDILRAIGRYIDANHIQDVILLQSEDGILLRGYRRSGDAGGGGASLIQHLFTDQDLRAIDEQSRHRRGSGSRMLQ